MIKAIQNSKIKIFYLVIGLVAATTFFVLQLSSKVNAEGERTGSPSVVLDEEREVSQALVIPAEELYFKTVGDAEPNNFEGRTAVHVNSGDVVCFDAEVPEAGTYYMNVTYYQPEEVLMTTRVTVSINGSVVQSDMKLPAWWENNTTYTFDEYGNELCKMPERVYEWTSYTLNSSLYQYHCGVGFELQAGENHLEIDVSETSLYIAEIILSEVNQTEDDLVSSGQTVVPAVLDGEPWTGIVEGELFTLQSNAQIHATKSKDSNLLPFNPGVNKVNSLDGGSWSNAGDAVTWQFTVPEDGYYAIVIKYRQEDKKDLSSYRHIYIDGEVVLTELYNYAFAYTGNKNKNEILSVDGEPISFYFTAGEHEIKMETTAESFADANMMVQQLVEDMNNIAMSIRTITGGKTDEDRDWDIEKYVPSLRDDLSALLVEMQELEDVLKDLKGAQSVLSTIDVAYNTVEKYLNQKDGLERLVNNLSGFAQASGSMAENISQLSGDLLEQPLTIDRLYITNVPSEVPKANVGLFGSAWSEIQKLFLSFVGEGNNTQQVKEDSLDVWMIGSAPQVEMLKQIIAEEYEAGEVNVSILSDETKLLLAIASGETPDVVLGGKRQTPYDYGVRGAVYDLTQFDDFQEYVSSFESEFFVPFIDGESVYALPQSLNFYVMFYRKDILDSLNLSVPKTWDEMIEMLPTLYRRGMTVNTTIANAPSIKPLIFTYPYMLQYGGSLYSEDGLESNLGDVETMQAFTLMTDLYTKYSVPTTVSNFYLSFRSGTVPMGMSDIGTYLLLREASTEISDSWGITTSLGVVREDGTIDNNYPAVATPCYILKDTDKPDEAWEFLKWWMCADTQLQYSEMLCTTYGDEYLWVSANLEALEGVSVMPEEDKKVILEQLHHTKEIPSHPASCLMERTLSNAWNEVVFSGKDTRTALDSAVIETNREIKRKLIELGYLDQEGDILRSLEITTSEKARELTGGTP